MQEYKYATRAMGTNISISVITDPETEAIESYTQTIATVKIYEECFSRFLPDSELSKLNQTRAAVVSPMFLEVLNEVMKISLATKSICNPLIQVARLGYRINFDDISDIQENETDDSCNFDLSAIEINQETRKVSLQAGQSLDFGGFLKGYLAEKIARTLMTNFPAHQGVIVNFGGDLHTRGVDKAGESFVFNIHNPVTKRDESLTVNNKSLATSGTYKRHWETREGTRHHIVDQSGIKNPDSDIISASVIHPSGIKSEVYAKIFLILPVAEALKIINDRSLTYLLITSKGDILMNI